MTPDGLGQVQVRGIGQQEKQVRVARLLHGPSLLHNDRLMDAGIVWHEYRQATGIPGEVVKLFGDEGRSDGVIGAAVAAHRHWLSQPNRPQQWRRNPF